MLRGCLLEIHTPPPTPHTTKKQNKQKSKSTHKNAKKYPPKQTLLIFQRRGIYQRKLLLIVDFVTILYVLLSIRDNHDMPIARDKTSSTSSSTSSSSASQ